MTKTKSTQPTTLLMALVAETVSGLLLGTIMAVFVGILCALVLHWTGLDNQLGMGSLGVTLYAGLLGFALGVAVGVTLAGRWLRQGGNFWLALMGAVLALILITLAMRNGFLSYSGKQLAVPVITSLIFAVLAYNLQRQSAA